MNNYKIVKNQEWKEVEINGEITEIPSVWCQVRFDNLFDVTSSRRVSADKYVERGIPFFRGTEINNLKKGIKKFDTFISKQFFEEIKSKYSLPNVNDILITAVGTVGNILLIDKNFDFYFKDGNIIWLKNKNDQNKKYIEFFLNSEYAKQKIFKLGAGSAYNALTIKNFSFSDCILPPLEQQSAIATILSKQEQIISNLETLIKKLELRFQYMSDELLSGRIRAKEENGKTILYKNTEWKEVEVNGEMTEIPSDWEMKKTKDFGLFKTSSVDKIIREDEKIVNLLNYMDVYTSKTKVIKQENIKAKTSINETKLQDNLILIGDIYFTPSSETADDIGHSAVICNPLEETVYSYHLVRFRQVKIELSPSFSKFLFNGKKVLKYFENKCNGTTRKTLKKDDFEMLDIFYPTSREQNNISSILDINMSLINRKKQQVLKEKNKFTWLSKNLLSGIYVIENK